MGFLDHEHAYTQRLQRMAANKAGQPPRGSKSSETPPHTSTSSVEERMALYDAIRRNSHGTQAGSSNPVARAWKGRSRRRNVALLSMALAGPVWFTLVLSLSSDGNGWIGFLSLLAIVSTIVGLVGILRVPPICQGCNQQLYPMNVGSQKLGESRGYGTETRVAETYTRDPYGGGGLQNPSVNGYGIYPTQRTTYTVSYPTLTEHFRNYFQCPNCGFQSTKLARQTRRIG